ncbi:MAG: hypothetical protein AAF138_11615, partial [Planctomycetota bacterium]
MVLLMLVGVVSAMIGGTAASQPGLALRDPDLAIARDGFAPRIWRFGAINEPVSLVVPWFGSSDELPDDEWRTLLVVLPDSLEITANNPDPRPPLFLLRYNPAESAVEMLTLYQPRVVGREPVPGERDETALGAIRVEGVPFDAPRHHCAVLTFDPAIDAFTLHVASEGSANVRTAVMPQPAQAIPKMDPDGRIYVGNPYAGGTSHTGPIFPTVFRRGLIGAAELQDVWQTPGGPRLTDLIGPGFQIDEDVIFLMLHSGDPNYASPADTGQMRAWFEGDSTTWPTVVFPRTIDAVRNGEPTNDLSTIEQTPVFEPVMPWSGWWQTSTPVEQLQLGLEPVGGSLPRFTAVLRGTRVGDAALTAWGLGNSRWSNTTPTPTSLTDPAPLSRSHLLGLRAARPDRDGGLIVLNLSAIDSIEGVEFVDTIPDAPEIDIDRRSNWTRFSYGGSFAP